MMLKTTKSALFCSKVKVCREQGCSLQRVQLVFMWFVWSIKNFLCWFKCKAQLAIVAVRWLGSNCSVSHQLGDVRDSRDRDMGMRAVALDMQKHEKRSQTCKGSKPIWWKKNGRLFFGRMMLWEAQSLCLARPSRDSRHAHATWTHPLRTLAVKDNEIGSRCCINMHETLGLSIILKILDNQRKQKRDMHTRVLIFELREARREE